MKNADPERVHRSWKSWKRAMTDSGTLAGYTLNRPDTVFSVLKDQKSLENFYRRFLSESGPDQLQQWIARMPEHGLAQDFYHAGFIRLCSRRIDRGAWIEKDKIPYDSFALFLLLSADAMCGMQQDLGSGRVEPSCTGGVYAHARRRIAGMTRMITADDPWAELKKAEPDWPEYRLLMQEAKRLQNFPDTLLGKDIALPAPLKPGRGLTPKQALAIGAKLRLRGYLKMHDTVLAAIPSYNDTLFKPVRQFQADQGMTPDGILGPATARELNRSRDQLLVALSGSMERWRWLGPVKDSGKIWVNIAANLVQAWRNDSLKLEMRTCSGEPRGKKYYEKLKASKKPGSRVLPPDNLETPMFKAKTSHFVVNPTWYVPRNIIAKEMLPDIRKNPEILQKMGYIVKNSRGEEIDPHSINWWAVSPGRVNFTIEQTTGAENSLGLVVIHFPNPYSIFMHDTPAKWVFGLDERHVSHGCIRLEKPFALVEFLTSFNKKDNYDKALMAAGLAPEHDTALLSKWEKAEQERKDTAGVFKPVQDKYFRLDSALPVYIVYFTAWSRESGKIVYSRDAYHRDSRILLEMKRPGKKRRKQAG